MTTVILVCPTVYLSMIAFDEIVGVDAANHSDVMSAH
jgi:hypothetical protein